MTITSGPTVPGAPTNVIATAGNGSALIAWTAPSNDGGAPITDFTVTSSPSGLTCKSTETACTVTGLTNGTTYTFTVTATNVIGTGAPSAPSNSVNPHVTNLFFNVLATGTPLIEKITLCLNGKGSLSCQVYTIHASNLFINTNIPNHFYDFAAIKINGYSMVGCTLIQNGNCLFPVSNTTIRLIRLSKQNGVVQVDSGEKVGSVQENVGWAKRVEPTA